MKFFCVFQLKIKSDFNVEKEVAFYFFYLYIDAFVFVSPYFETFNVKTN
jgi:hypothetical protein